jgi:hypothetical protein
MGSPATVRLGDMNTIVSALSAMMVEMYAQGVVPADFDVDRVLAAA